eukprot:scaffold20571_cov111-Isochrysis_galbana.AAC.9
MKSNMAMAQYSSIKRSATQSARARKPQNKRPASLPRRRWRGMIENARTAGAGGSMPAAASDFSGWPHMRCAQLVRLRCGGGEGRRGGAGAHV